MDDAAAVLHSMFGSDADSTERLPPSANTSRVRPPHVTGMPDAPHRPDDQRNGFRSEPARSLGVFRDQGASVSRPRLRTEADAVDAAARPSSQLLVGLRLDPVHVDVSRPQGSSIRAGWLRVVSSNHAWSALTVMKELAEGVRRLVRLDAGLAFQRARVASVDDQHPRDQSHRTHLPLAPAAGSIGIELGCGDHGRAQPAHVALLL